MAAPAPKAAAFTPLKRLAGLAELPEAERALLEQLNSIRLDLARLQAPPVVTELKTSDYLAGEDETVRYAPNGASTLLLPKPRIENRGRRVTVLLESVARGALTVQCVGGLVNGAASQAVALVCRIDFVCDGVAGWRSEVAPGAVPLTALAAQANDTIVANLSGASAVPTATTVATVASRLRGVGLTVASGRLLPRQRPRAAQVRDFLLSGNAASGSIGALGWNLLGTGTPAYARANATQMGSSGRGALSTSAAANDRSVLALGETETRDITIASDVTLLQCAWNHDNNLTNKRVFFGLMGTLATEPSAAVDCLGVYYDSAVDAHYQIIARASSVGSPTITTASVPANTAELMTIYQSAAGTYQFYSGNTLIGTISSGVPTAAMNVGFRLETLTTAAKTVNLGYFGIEATAAGAFDDDAFLEV